MEFNAQQLLFEAFSHIMRIFDNIQPLSESTSSCLYIIIFQRRQSLEPFNFTPGGDRHMHSLPFLYAIQCSTTFI